MWGKLDDREREARRGLLHLIAAGVMPDSETLAKALGCDTPHAAQLLDALLAKGFAVLDGAGGGIAAAYPLSVRPTAHRVTLTDGRAAYALCAMDALGVSPLFGVGATIDSRCPHCGRSLRLAVQDGELRRRRPATTALWYGLADLLEHPVEGLNLAAEH